MMATFGAIILGIVAVITVWVAVEGWPMLIIAGVIFAICWRTRTHFRSSTRLHSAATERLCPDCDYDLNGADAAIEPSLFGGHSVGPRRYPECGSPWPLVPAPLAGGECAPT